MAALRNFYRRLNINERDRIDFLIPSERTVWIEPATLGREGIHFREAPPLIGDFEGDLATRRLKVHRCSLSLALAWTRASDINNFILHRAETVDLSKALPK